MSYREYISDVSVDTTLVTVAETVIATVTGVTMSRAGQAIPLRGEAVVITGAGTTALTLRVRRDGIAGPVVGDAPPEQIEAAAGSTETHTIMVRDIPPGELSNATYVLTVQQTAAGANGTVLRAQLVASVD